MEDTFERLVKIVCNNTDLTSDKVSIDAHIFSDLGVDSLDFLDIAYEIDSEFSVQIPIEEWTTELEEKGSLEPDYFIVRNLVSFVTEQAK